MVCPKTRSIWNTNADWNKVLFFCCCCFSVQKYERVFFFFFFFFLFFWGGAVLFRPSNIAWHCTSARQCQTPCSTPHHTVPRQQQLRPDSPLAFHVPRLEPKQTHLERVGETCSRQSERRSKFAWVVSATRVGVDGQPSARDSQPDPVHAFRDAVQLLILDRGGYTPCWCACPSVATYRMVKLYLGREECLKHLFWAESFVCVKWKLKKLFYFFLFSNIN